MHKKYLLPIGDFPGECRKLSNYLDLNAFKEKLEQWDFSKFPKLDQKRIDSMEQVQHMFYDVTPV